MRAPNAAPTYRPAPAALALAVVAVLGFFSWGLGSASAAKAVGTAVIVVHDVRGTPPGEAAKPVRQGDGIVLQELITTGKASEITMIFPPGGSLQLGESSSFRVDSQAIDDATGRTTSFLSLVAGKLRLAVRKLAQAVQVGTPEAVSGVKGTAVRFLVAPLVGTFVAVDEGVVSVRSRAGGEAVDVAAGQWVLVPPGGRPTRPAPLARGQSPLEDPPLIDRFDLQFEPPKPPPPGSRSPNG
ncbi:MAG TPA: FecR domain-containing protein [Thermoanaerobaculia bacterium]|nr:FecR domain-containing protein [Thermoanaerobaculia bacterium]